MGNGCSNTYCLSCYPNYNLVNNFGNVSCVWGITNNLEDNSEESNSNTGAVVGLAVWGTVMTIALGVVLFLWYRKANAKPAVLLGGENEPRTVSF